MVQKQTNNQLLQLRSGLVEVLGVIVTAGGRVTAKELAKLMGVALSTGYTYLNDLRDLGFVERVKVNSHSGSRKEYLYSLTVSSDELNLANNFPAEIENNNSTIFQADDYPTRNSLSNSEDKRASADQMQMILEVIFRLTARVVSLEEQLATSMQRKSKNYSLLSEIQQMLCKSP